MRGKSEDSGKILSFSVGKLYAHSSNENDKIEDIKTGEF
jgi:hypothetical protein